MDRFVLLPYPFDQIWRQRRGQRMLAGKDNAVRCNTGVKPQIDNELAKLHCEPLNLIMLVSHGWPQLHRFTRPIEQFDADMVLDVLNSA